MLLLLAGFVFVLTYRAPVSSTGVTLLSLLVSQAVVEQGTVQLDAYQEQMAAAFTDNYRVGEGKRAHVLRVSQYAISVGGAGGVGVAAVWVGYDANLAVFRCGTALVGFSLCVFILSFTLYATARLYLPTRSSLWITAVFMLGSSLVSTLGVAFWSADFATLFGAIVLLLLSLHEQKHPVRGLPFG
ncbi:MAG: hypothetical protein R3E31_14355 [Chloroflexota bacterium]